MREKMKEIEDFWKTRKVLEEELDSEKKKLQMAIDSKDEYLIAIHKDLIEKVYKDIELIEENINQMLKEIFNKEDEKESENNFVEKQNVFKREPKKENDAETIKISFNIAEGQYKYEQDNITCFIERFDRNGKERLTKKQQKDIRDEIVSLGVSKKNAKKVDLYIYKMLDDDDGDIKREYVKSFEKKGTEIENLKIRYDLRENQEKKNQFVKLSFWEKLKIRNTAKVHKKHKIAEVLIDKSKAKIYGLLAGLGLSTLVSSGIAVKEIIDNQKAQVQTEVENDIDEEPIIIIYDEEQLVQQQSESQQMEDETIKAEVEEAEADTETEKEIENETVETEAKTEAKETEKEAKIDNKIIKTEKSLNLETKKNATESKENKTVDSNKQKEEKLEEYKIGNLVSVELGTHLYSDPFDAVKEALKKQPNEKIVVKAKNEDVIYKISRTGVYYPDGTCIEISSGDIRAAMEKQGMDANILDKIYSGELNEQGYKMMLHLVADGISCWVDANDATQLEVDRFGNRIEKTKSEKAKEAKQVEDYKFDDSKLAQLENEIEER